VNCEKVERRLIGTVVVVLSYELHSKSLSLFFLLFSSLLSHRLRPCGGQSGEAMIWTTDDVEVYLVKQRATRTRHVWSSSKHDRTHIRMCRAGTVQYGRPCLGRYRGMRIGTNTTRFFGGGGFFRENGRARAWWWWCPRVGASLVSTLCCSTPP
jgi:hypothetical protein